MADQEYYKLVISFFGCSNQREELYRFSISFKLLLHISAMLNQNGNNASSVFGTQGEKERRIAVLVSVPGGILAGCMLCLCLVCGREQSFQRTDSSLC